MARGRTAHVLANGETPRNEGFRCYFVLVNVLSDDRRLKVLAALVEGNSIRAASRMTDVHQDTIGRFALQMGEGSQRLHDRLVQDLPCSLIQVDEIWSYVQKKQARVMPDDSADVGEAYTFVALDATSRLVIAYHVGKRNQESTDVFIADVRARLTVMPQITADGFAPYISSIGAWFGPAVDFAQTIKNYRVGSSRGPDHRYEPARDPFITKHVVYGTPDMKSASTSYIERNNGTIRHHIGRMRRLCLAFSKKLANHRAAVALCYAWYNFGMVVKTLCVSPAMAAGITDHVWELEEFMHAALAEVPRAKPVAGPLAHRAPEGPARELPAGRGFLRLVTEPMPARKHARHPRPSAPSRRTDRSDDHRGAAPSRAALAFRPATGWVSVALNGSVSPLRRGRKWRLLTECFAEIHTKNWVGSCIKRTLLGRTVLSRLIQVDPPLLSEFCECPPERIREPMVYDAAILRAELVQQLSHRAWRLCTQDHNAGDRGIEGHADTDSACQRSWLPRVAKLRMCPNLRARVP